MDEQMSMRPEAVPNLDSRLSDDERQFRKMLLNRLIEAGRPLTVDELAEGCAPESAARYEELAGALRAKGLLVRDDNGAIVGLYPVSARPTNHRVRLADGREFFAMCAIDALGCAFEFDLDTVITSSCSHCRVPLTMTMEKGGVGVVGPPDIHDIHALHVDLDYYANWAANC